MRTSNLIYAIRLYFDNDNVILYLKNTMNFRKAYFPITLFWSYVPNTLSYLSHLPVFHCRFLFKHVEANSY